ncbi:MAG: DNA translocase FtsK 4TM domain-containing protein [Parcubacteria group bacterium]
MVRRRKKKKKEALEYIAMPKLNLEANVKQSIILIFILVLAIISAFGLFGQGGKTGTYIAQGLGLAFGWGKWLFPILIVVWASLWYQNKKKQIKAAHYVGLFFLFITYQSLFTFFYDKKEWINLANAKEAGGYLGLYLSVFFSNLFGFWGGLAVLIALFLISWILIFNRPLSHILPKGTWLLAPVRLIASIFKKREKDYSEAEFEEVEEENENLFLPENKEEDDEESEAVVFSQKAVSASADIEQAVKNTKTKNSVNKWKSKGLKIDLPLDLLKDKEGKAAGGNIDDNNNIIKKTLANFGISVEMGKASVGPTVTQYTFKPTEGVKLSKVTALSNDLSLSLAAHPIRIEAPIPGKSLVGIEVPNKTKAMVGLKAMLKTEEFAKRKTNLLMALGEDVTGGTWFYDITKMPHLLVAGATNSGKSVCLNSIIISLLYQNNPDDLRFIMVDPKRVELPIYNGIPHLLTPVITEVPKTINALKWCLNEMDRRFDTLQQHKKKNIASYNELMTAKGKDKMPYIIFIIDELADLMVAASKDIEGSVIRLAQMARAVGIHLILATQRPSVDVITGLIKANIPARIAFSVTSAIDSKTILDTAGAEKLLGQGDMLISTPDTSRPKRLQGAYVSDKEIKDICDYIKEKSGEADYLDDVTERQQVKGMGGVGLDGTSGDEDELLEEAKEIVINANKASTSMLQRRLRIGYGRAASILDNLEESGIIGPSNGSKPREVLVSKEQYEALLDQGTSGVSLHNKEESEAPDSYLGGDDGSEYSENDVDDNEEEVVEDDTEEIQEDKEEPVETDEAFPVSSDKDLSDEDIEDDTYNNEENKEEKNNKEETEEITKEEDLEEEDEGDNIDDDESADEEGEKVKEDKNNADKNKDNKNNKEEEKDDWWDEGMYFSK